MSCYALSKLQGVISTLIFATCGWCRCGRALRGGRGGAVAWPGGFPHGADGLPPDSAGARFPVWGRPGTGPSAADVGETLWWPSQNCAVREENR